MKRKYSLLGLALAFAVSASYAEIPIVKGEIWRDTDGNHINCHGGGMFKAEDGTYYWYGEHRGANRTPQDGVACYTSTDLKTWTNRGIVLPVSSDTTSVMARGCKIERPKVIYNEKTGKYVMWFHHELRGKGYGSAHAAVAIADNPLGPFTTLESGRVNVGVKAINMADSVTFTDEDKTLKWWTPEWRTRVSQGIYNVRDLENGQMARDMSLFVDEDGKAYHIFSSESNLTLHIAELDESFTKHTGKYIRIFPGGHNEAPVIFKKDSRYWMITSGCSGWEPNAARLMWADEIMGEWHQLPNPCKGEGADKTFGGQGTFALQEGDNLTFMADIWNANDLPDSRHLWLPINFTSDGVPEVSMPSSNTDKSDKSL